MLIHLPRLLPAELVAELVSRLDGAPHVPGAETAQGLARSVKNNLQVTGDTPLGAELGAKVLEALNRSAEFHESAIPVRLTPPLFNLHEQGMFYGMHSDSVLMNGIGGILRADLSMTVFLSDPSEYAGGELDLRDPAFGQQSIKLAPGDAVLYPTLMLHAVRPVTQGRRRACVVWVQSAVRDATQRHMLHRLAQVGRGISAGQADQMLAELNQLHQNLLRLWAQP